MLVGNFVLDLDQLAAVLFPGLGVDETEPASKIPAAHRPRHKGMRPFYSMTGVRQTSTINAKTDYVTVTTGAEREP
jgi:hypothetical protein